MLLMPGGDVFGAVEIGEPHGQPGLGHVRLMVPLMWKTPARPDSRRATISELRGQLKVSGEFGGEAQRLGQAAPEHPVRVRDLTTDNDTHTDFVAELDSSRIEAVERLRRGGDLTLHVTVSGTLATRGERWPVQTEVSRKIAQAAWLRVLGAMGYGKAIVVEVPVLATGVCPDLSEAAARLERATIALRRGDCLGAVAASREVLDAIQNTPAARSLGELPSKREEWTKAQRFQNLRRALFTLASAAHHADEHAAAIEWERPDALAVVAAVAAELMRCCEEVR